MSEYRQNFTNGQWVVIATERARRPEDFRSPVHGNLRPLLPVHSAECPFCRGGDAEYSEPSIERFDSEGNWTLRVIANKFASVNRNVEPRRSQQGLFMRANGYGTADVLIENPRHDLHPALMETQHLALVLDAYRARFLQLMDDPALNIVNIFRNHGPKAGASLAHPHSQIIGTLVIPPHVSDQIHYARRAYNTWGGCLYCTSLEEELRQKERILVETEHFVAYCPFASRSPFETRIQPKRHTSLFGNISDAEVADLGVVLRTVLRWIYNALGDPDYNFIIRSNTNGDGEVRYYHWYMVIIPKLSYAAGMEIGSGIYINPTWPEECARVLRESGA